MSGQLNTIDRPHESSVGDSNHHRAINRKRRADPSIILLNINVAPVTPQAVPTTPSSQVLTEPFYPEEDEVSRKRRRYDSGISTLSDESDSQLSTASDISPFSKCGKGQLEPFCNGDIIGDFKIIGSGYEAKAIYGSTSTVYDCKILNEIQAESMTKLIARLDEAHQYYPNGDIDEMRNMIVPEDACIVLDSKNRHIYFTLPTGHGKTLHSFAESKGPDMSELDVQPIFQQIISVVAFCHRIGIIVRELKPKKLGLSKEGKLRINHPWDLLVLDSPKSDIIKEKLKGSPAYAPPEALCSSEDGYSGKAADMWGLGVLLYLLLLGRYPFYDKTPLGVFQKIMQARVVVPSQAVITKHVRVLLYCLLRKRAADRPSAEDLKYTEWIGAQRAPSRSSCISRATATMYDSLQADFRNSSNSRVLDIALSTNVRERPDFSNLRLGMLQSIFHRGTNQERPERQF
ncbi:unnamed protein product [Auanema sp. JU1783]|nr:unnamed protein product [Auanema sp. JU1783]